MKEIILLVEDDASIRKLLKRRLEKKGYEIYEAVNGEEGVSIAFRVKPILILLDMHMPVLDGYGAARKLRSGGYEGKVVALTASAMVEDKKQALNAGCDFFIPKPIGRDFETTLEGYLKEVHHV